jgi:hypothetical protein
VSAEDEEKNEAARKAKRYRKGMAILRAANGTRERAVAYLEGRGINLVPDEAKLLPPPVIQRLTGKRFPAMVMPIIDGSGEPQAALVTFLSRDGTKNLRGQEKKSIRRIFGPSKGGYVRDRVVGSTGHRPTGNRNMRQGEDAGDHAAPLLGIDHRHR